MGLSKAKGKAKSIDHVQTDLCASPCLAHLERCWEMLGVGSFCPLQLRGHARSNPFETTCLQATLPLL